MKKSIKIGVALLVAWLSAILVCGMILGGTEGFHWKVSTAEKRSEQDEFGLRPPSGQGKSQPVRVGIRVMQEFDFLPKVEIMRRRIEAVERSRELYLGTYTPSAAIFEQIVDNRPWWGIEGLYYYGPGKESIKGPSEESRMFLNPFLLVAITESAAWGTGLPAPAKAEYYPVPSDLVIDPESRTGEVRYDMSGYMKYSTEVHHSRPETRVLTLTAYNARDFGFNFLAVDAAATGAFWMEMGNQPVPLIEFIHQGGSCGYPEGCNNASPYQKGMTFTLTGLPAAVPLKLWKSRPQDNRAPADFVFTIILEGRFS